MAEKESLSSFTIFLYKLKERFLAIFTNMKITIILIVSIITMFYILTANHLEKEFQKNIEAISKNIAFAIEINEAEMRKTLLASALFIQKDLNPLNLSKTKLIEITKKLDVSGINLYNKNGFMIASNTNVLDEGYEHSFYREISIIDLKQCETQICGTKLCRTREHEVRDCKIRRALVNDVIANPGLVNEVPMMFMFHDMKKVPVQWMHLYDSTLGKIITVMYRDINVSKTIEKALETNTNLLYIAIKNNTNDLIMEAERRGDGGKAVNIQFGKEWHFNIDGKDITYYYNLYAEFSAKELMNQIWIVRILFLVITILFILLLLSFRAKLKMKEDGIKTLKNIIKKGDAYTKN